MTAPTTVRAATPAAAVIAAHDLIARYGFWTGGFGTHPLGFSVEGGIYEACGLRESDLDLADPDSPEMHRRWVVATAAIRAVAADLGVTVPSRAFGAVCDWSEQADRERALILLRRVWGRLMTAGGAA